MNILETVGGWKFLNETGWRWFFFIFALIAILAAWRAILHRV